jgi:hypothetical protein
MATVVIGGGGDDAQTTGDRSGGARQGHRLLEVEPLGDEERAEAEILGVANLVDEGPGRLRRPGQAVEAELGQ